MGTHISIIFVLMTLAGGVAISHAASAASKNKEGNRLFTEGKYEEAEKAYLEAQEQLPDRPELIYNLGNALLKQKKIVKAIQSLRQSISKGDQGIQASSWFNVGNAHYEMGNFKESIDAYRQSLRINPADRDAKHNLELALKNLQEQEQNSQSQDQNENQQDQGKKESDSKSQSGDQQQQDNPKQENPESSEPKQGKDQGANPQSTRADPDEGSFTKEQALRILDALQNQELAEQRKRLKRRARRKVTGKDW